MKIGLVRHFKVDCTHKPFINSTEFLKWSYNYDFADIIKNEVNLKGTQWDVCYCSDLFRAKVTAKEIYDGEIIETKLLREIPNYAPNIRKMKLPIKVWGFVSYFSWNFNLKLAKENKVYTRNKVKKFFDEIEKSGYNNVLIVSHAGIMFNLKRELKLRNYKGDFFKKIPSNGKLYLFENNSS